MTPDIKAIRAAAEAAPTEGMWRYEPNGQTVWCDNTYMVADIRGWGHLQYLPNGKALQDATGVHIATANPSTVIALCDEVERLQHANGNPLAMLGIDQLHDENKELRQEVERLRNEVHNLNWALGTEGYTQMATPEEQAEHEAAVCAVQKNIDRLEDFSVAYEAMKKDAARYQWLRGQHWGTDVIGVLVRPKTHSHLGSIFPSLKLLDDTIDHMMEKLK